MSEKEWRDYELGRGPSPGDTRPEREWDERLDEKGDVAWWESARSGRKPADTPGEIGDDAR